MTSKKHEKARKLVAEDRVEMLPKASNNDYEMWEVEGGHGDYNVEYEKETGASICTCPHPYSCGNTKGSMCSHQLAIHWIKFEEVSDDMKV